LEEIFMLGKSLGVLTWVLGFALVACFEAESSDDDESGGCEVAVDCREGRICVDGECVSSGAGGTAGAGGTGGAATGGTSGSATGGTSGSATGGVGAGGTTGGGSTLGEHCEDVLGTFCSRSYLECAVDSTSYSACVMAALDACCSTNCGDPSPASDAEILVCVNDMNVQTCTQLQAGELPPSCQGVLAP
jgi:hypothetical protein